MRDVAFRSHRRLDSAPRADDARPFKSDRIGCLERFGGGLIAARLMKASAPIGDDPGENSNSQRIEAQIPTAPPRKPATKTGARRAA